MCDFNFLRSLKWLPWEQCHIWKVVALLAAWRPQAVSDPSSWPFWGSLLLESSGLVFCCCYCCYFLLVCCASNISFNKPFDVLIVIILICIRRVEWLNVLHMPRNRALYPHSLSAHERPEKITYPLKDFEGIILYHLVTLFLFFFLSLLVLMLTLNNWILKLKPSIHSAFSRNRQKV